MSNWLCGILFITACSLFYLSAPDVIVRPLIRKSAGRKNIPLCDQEGKKKRFLKLELTLRLITCQGRPLVFLCLPVHSNTHKSCISAGCYWSRMKSSGKTAADFAGIWYARDHLQQRKFGEILRFVFEYFMLLPRKSVILLGMLKNIDGQRKYDLIIN